MTPLDLLKEPSSHDIAWRWVTVILPGDTSTAYGQAFASFSAALTLIAAMLLSWHVLSGIVHSAYSGKVLGEKWHQIWAPLRVVFGFGLLIPLTDTGFSSVHYVIRDGFARVGTNLGNAVWSPYVEAVATHQMPILPASSGGSGVVVAVLEHEICAAIYNKAGDTWGWSAKLPVPEGQPIGNRVHWNYGTTCGQFSVSIPDRRADFSEARRSALGAIVTASRTAANQIAEVVTETTGVNTVEAYRNAVGAKLLSENLVRQIRAAGAAYDEAIVAAAKASVSDIASDSRARLVEAAKQQGWAAAGTYWMGLSQISGQVTSLTNEKPENQAPRTDGDFGQTIQKGFDTLRMMVSGEATRVELTANDYAAAADERSDFLTRLIGPLMKSLGEWATTKIDSDTESAMGRVVSSGHTMIAAAEAAIIGGGAVMVASSNWLASALGADGAAGWFMDWSKWLIGATWLVGIVRAYIIPILPLIFVFMAGILFAVSIIEAMIAGLLWSFGFVRMDGDEFIAQAQSLGLKMLFNITLRPALAVLSLCGGYQFTEIALRTLHELFGIGFWAQQGGHIAGISALITAILVQAWLEWQIATRGLSMIAALPDRVAHWYGQQTQGHGDSEHTAAATAGAMALAQRGTPGAIPVRALSKSAPTNTTDRRVMKGKA